jgi:DNA-binding transcriptional regulator GbsR (MarR family)
MSEAKNTRSEVLAIAGDLINGDRQAHYGTPQDNFGTTAEMWTAYLGRDISPADVCHMMALLKIARLKRGPHRDSSIDACGYMALGAEVSE